MRRINYCFFLFVLLLCACTSSKKLAEEKRIENLGTELSIPFSEPKYQSDETFFRYVQSGTSPSRSISKKMAILNAKTGLSSTIESVVSSVSEQYVNQVETENKTEYQSTFEEMTKLVVDNSLHNTHVIEEKCFQQSDGKYTTWVVVEMAKQGVKNQVLSSIEKIEDLQLDFNKQKFETIFEESLSKL